MRGVRTLACGAALAGCLSCVTRHVVVLPSPTLEREGLPRAKLAGRVVDAVDQRPVAHAVVYLRQDPPADDGEIAPGAVTDSSGRFVLQAVLPGEYDLLARAGDRIGITEQSLRVSAGDSWSDLRVEVWPGATLAGSVISPVGSPLPDADVSVVRDGPFAWAEDARAASNGSFTLGGLFPGFYTARVRSGRVVAVFRGLAVTGTTRVALVVAPAGPLRHHPGSSTAEELPAAPDHASPPRFPVDPRELSEAAGIALDRAEHVVTDYDLWVADAGAPFNHPERPRLIHDPKGVFAFRHAACDCVITARASGGAVARARVHLGEGERRNDLVLRFGKGARLAGRVVDGSGPAPHLAVTVLAFDLRDRREVETAEDGSFEVGGLMPSEGATAWVGGWKLWSGTLREGTVVDLGRVKLP